MYLNFECIWFGCPCHFPSSGKSPAVLESSDAEHFGWFAGHHWIFFWGMADMQFWAMGKVICSCLVTCSEHQWASELCTGKWFQRRSATGLWLRICELRIGNLITFNLYWSMLNVTFWCISVRFVATNLIPNSQRLADVNHYITRVALRTPSVASTAC